MAFVDDHAESLLNFADEVGDDMAEAVGRYTNQGEEQWEKLISFYADPNSTPQELVAYVMSLQQQEMGVMLMVASAIEHERRQKEKSDGIH